MRSLNPELATLATRPPVGSDWLHETKYDGYRILAVKARGKVHLFSRTGRDYSSRFPLIATELEYLNATDFILDGEVVALRPDGRSDFQALQNALSDSEKIKIDYFIFDLLELEGRNLRGLELLERKKLLAELVPPERRRRLAGHCHFSPHVLGHGDEVFAKACEAGIEGIVSKNIHSTYRSTRTLDWQKVKCVQRQEFVIGGYLKSEGGQAHFRSLMLGVYDSDGTLRYAGNVGTGFNATLLKEISRKLKPLEQNDCPFTPELNEKRAIWVKPKLVCEVQYTEWTRGGSLRHPSFKGLREDKPAPAVHREKPMKQKCIKDGERLEVEGISLSHPEKIIFPEGKLTKLDLVHYYQKVARLIMPYLVGRPLSVVRCPDGSKKACFFQRHPRETLTLDVIFGFKDKSSSKDRLIYIEKLSGLIGLVQFGSLEIHPWGSTVAEIEKPDTIIFDLDPAPDVKWKDVADAALALRKLLKRLGLVSFVKTSGGKGLHVIVPIRPARNWDEVKEFTRSVSELLTRQSPEKYLATMSKAKRKGKIFIDYLRNARSATSVAPYSSRAKPNAPVSWPIKWSQITKVGPQDFTVEKVLSPKFKLNNPWKQYFTIDQGIENLFTKGK